MHNLYFCVVYGSCLVHLFLWPFQFRVTWVDGGQRWPGSSCALSPIHLISSWQSVASMTSIFCVMEQSEFRKHTCTSDVQVEDINGPPHPVQALTKLSPHLAREKGTYIHTCVYSHTHNTGPGAIINLPVSPCKTSCDGNCGHTEVSFYSLFTAALSWSCQKLLPCVKTLQEKTHRGATSLFYHLVQQCRHFNFHFLNRQTFKFKHFSRFIRGTMHNILSKKKQKYAYLEFYRKEIIGIYSVFLTVKETTL